MRRSPALLLGVALGGVALDQWSKLWATRNLAFREPMHVVGDLVTFTYTRNSGIAFGMFQGKVFPFYIFSMVAALAVLWLWARTPHVTRAREWSLALILGGAVGNLIDRVRFGEVTDFIELGWRGHYFPVFNVTDMCVTFGVALFALSWTGDGHEGVAPGTIEEGGAPHADGGPDGAAGERRAAGGSLAGEGADRTLP